MKAAIPIPLFDDVGGNDGTLTNFPADESANWVTGNIDGALDFEGNPDYVAIPNESDYDFTDSFTVAAWFKIDAFDEDYQPIVTKGDNTWRLQRDASNNFLAFHVDGVEATNAGSINVNDGGWHHAVGVFDNDADTLSLYIDGAQDFQLTSQTGTPSTSNDPVHIGGNSETPGSVGWNGSIDDVRIYNRALSPAEISSLYSYTGAGVLQYCGLGGGTECQNVGDACADGAVFAGDTDLYVANTYQSNLAWKTLATDGAWRWYGGDIDTLQFWTGDESGSTGNYANWDSGNEPGGSTTENCLQFWGTGTPNPNSWNDENCFQDDAFICERDGPAADCSGLGDANVNNGSTGHCYYREDSTTWWHNAKKSCEANSAHLATIVDQTENDYIYTNLMSGISTAWLGGSDGFGADDISPDSLTDGQANHTNRSGTLSNFPAMEYCENLVRHSYSDWYLPSQDEFDVISTNEAALDSAVGNWPGGNPKFWTSSEDDTFAWWQNPSSGNQEATSKSQSLYALCVRRGDAPVPPSYSWYNLDGSVPSEGGSGSCASPMDETETFGTGSGGVGNGTFTYWTNTAGDDHDWDTDSDDTASGNVGPTSDQSSTGYFAFTEASSPVVASDEFHLISGTLPANCDIEVSFYYNMRGDNMGVLQLQKSINGGAWTTIWEDTDGEQASSGTSTWNLVDSGVDADLAFNESDTVELRFRAIMPGSGTIWNSDIGVDTIRVQAN